jgi:Fic/DOC family
MAVQRSAPRTPFVAAQMIARQGNSFGTRSQHRRIWISHHVSREVRTSSSNDQPRGGWPWRNTNASTIASMLIRISKEGSAFCYPEHIDRQLKQVFGALKNKQFLRNLSADEFAEQAAAFLSHLNAIHAFRDGNGRAQLAFMALEAFKAGHPLHLGRLDPKRFSAGHDPQLSRRRDFPDSGIEIARPGVMNVSSPGVR